MKIITMSGYGLWSANFPDLDLSFAKVYKYTHLDTTGFPKKNRGCLAGLTTESNAVIKP